MPDLCLQQVNRLNVSLFTPSLLFSKVAFFLTPGKSHTLVAHLWYLTPFLREAPGTMDNPTRICGDDGLLNGRVVHIWLHPTPEEVTKVTFNSRGFDQTALISFSLTRSFGMAASMFMNSNSLPIALMQSLVYSVKELRWGDDDHKDAMLGRALTYLVLYSTLGMVVRDLGAYHA